MPPSRWPRPRSSPSTTGTVGFGGSAIALVPTGQADAIAARVADAFAAAGYVAPSTFVVHPVAGAELLS